MRRQDFYYDLPEDLIAKAPAQERRSSRLLCLDGATGNLEDRQFADILSLVRPGDLMVFNDTRVIPARVFAQKPTGGKVEILVERVLASDLVLAHVRASKAPKPGGVLLLENGTEIEVVGRRDELFELKFPAGSSAMAVLEAVGHIPLPPYINRPDEVLDRERYQRSLDVILVQWQRRLRGCILTVACWSNWLRREWKPHLSPCMSARAPFSLCGWTTCAAIACTAK